KTPHPDAVFAAEMGKVISPGTDRLDHLDRLASRPEKPSAGPMDQPSPVRLDPPSGTPYVPHPGAEARRGAPGRSRPPPRPAARADLGRLHRRRRRARTTDRRAARRLRPARRARPGPDHARTRPAEARRAAGHP